MGERVILSKKTEANRRHSAVGTKSTLSARPTNHPLSDLLQFHGTIGNKAVGRMFRAGVLQAKLRIGEPNDIYEREADRVAEQVVSMPDAGVGGRSATHGRSAGGQGNDVIRTKFG